MLNYTDRRIIFRLLCLAILSGIAIQIVLVAAAVWQGTLTVKVVAMLLNGAGLGGYVFAGRKIIEKEFLQNEILPFARLHHFASERSDLMSRQETLDPYEARRSLIARTLQLAEETLRGWLPGSHFELCVFVDSSQPLLFSYFDSNRDFTARSMAARARQPSFYIDKNYEVTKLLRNPTSRALVIEDTHSKRSTYSFTTSEQRKQVRSTLLLCVDLETPCALVITSDEKNAFSLKDEKLTSFVRFIAGLVRSDLFDGGFIYELKSLKPDLFPVSEAALAPPFLVAPPREKLSPPSEPLRPPFGPGS